MSSWLAADGGRRALRWLVLLVALLAVAWPLFSATYPPLTDLPFHAAQTAVFAHHGDPSFHFQEQFELTPFSVPYLSSYLLGALLMQICSAATAVKLATLVMLLLLPLGLGVLCWGMGKSPLLGLAATPLCWGHLTHWGFINFVSALGLMAACLGLALARLRNAGERGRLEGWLALSLLALFFTHVFRFPFAWLAIVPILGLLVVRERSARALWPLAPATLCFAWFWTHRPPGVSGSAGPLTLQLGRIAELPRFVVDAYADPAEQSAFVWFFLGLLLVALVSGAKWLTTAGGPLDQHVRASQAYLSLICLGLLLGYLLLPMEIGDWWYVYPREATAVLYFALALLPDLPKRRELVLAAVVVLALGTLGVSSVVARHARQFDDQTRDFVKVADALPQAPKLLYLVFDHSGSERTQPPFLHLPAWIQAEKGGWLSFHFANFGASPVRYRTDSAAVVPPAVPRRWEWTPQAFRLQKHGAFFEWFLVRSEESPAHLFQSDSRIELVRQDGKYWLFSRKPPRGASSP